jgi:hypothetical protein
VMPRAPLSASQAPSGGGMYCRAICSTTHPDEAKFATCSHVARPTMEGAGVLVRVMLDASMSLVAINSEGHVE